jgi:hypothetical protein
MPSLSISPSLVLPAEVAERILATILILLLRLRNSERSPCSWNDCTGSRRACAVRWVLCIIVLFSLFSLSLQSNQHHKPGTDFKARFMLHSIDCKRTAGIQTMALESSGTRARERKKLGVLQYTMLQPTEQDFVGEVKWNAANPSVCGLEPSGAPARKNDFFSFLDCASLAEGIKEKSRRKKEQRSKKDLGKYWARTTSPEG